jgi:hypothetical protein
MKATQVKAVDTMTVKNCEVCGKPTSLPYGRTQNYGVLCSKLCDAVFQERKRNGYEKSGTPS